MCTDEAESNSGRGGAVAEVEVVLGGVDAGRHRSIAVAVQVVLLVLAGGDAGSNSSIVVAVALV